MIQTQQAETDKFRQSVTEYQSVIQNKQELNRDIAEAVKNAMSEERAAQAAIQAANDAAAAGSQQTMPSVKPSYTDFRGIVTPAFGSPVKPVAYDLTQNDFPLQASGSITAASLLSPPPRTADPLTATPKVLQCPGCNQL